MDAARRMREALGRALAEADADERIGPRIAATGISLRLELTDAKLTLDLWVSEELSHSLRWSFDGSRRQPRLVLRMPAATANRYLQGRESLAIAIAHGGVSCRGEPFAALRCLPAARLLSGPYSAVVERDFPELASEPARGAVDATPSPA